MLYTLFLKDGHRLKEKISQMRFGMILQSIQNMLMKRGSVESILGEILNQKYYSLQICFARIDGVDYFEYCKALYMLVYPRSVRKEILNLTTEREKIEARKSRKLMVLSSDEEHGIVDLGSSDVDVSRSKTIW